MRTKITGAGYGCSFAARFVGVWHLCVGLDSGVFEPNKFDKWPVNYSEHSQKPPQTGDGKKMNGSTGSWEGSQMNRYPSDEQWWYRAGGISAFALAIGYFIIIAFYVPAGAPPGGVEARLAYHAGNTVAWWGILGFSVLTDFLFVPVMLALYLTLKGVNRYALLVAIAFVGLFVILDLAITWTNYASLIALGSSYAAATDSVQRSAIVAAAMFPVTVLESVLFRIYTILVPAIGFLITSLVMLKGSFSKLTAYLGLAASILSIISAIAPLFVSALGITVVIASTLTTFWIFAVGYELYRSGQR